MKDKMMYSANDGRKGIILIVVGLVLLAGQIISWGDAGILIPAGLGLAFMSAGILQRKPGLMIPGGILGGIGLGILINEGPLAHLAVIRNNSDAWFMAAFALGWFSIVGVTALFSDRTRYWPLIPGGIMALIALARLAGGALETTLSVVGRGWPVLLIVLGLWLLSERRAASKAESYD